MFDSVFGQFKRQVKTIFLSLLHTQVFHYTVQPLRALLLELGSRVEPIVPVALTVEQCVYFIHSHHFIIGYEPRYARTVVL